MAIVSNSANNVFPINQLMPSMIEEALKSGKKVIPIYDGAAKTIGTTKRNPTGFKYVDIKTPSNEVLGIDPATKAVKAGVSFTDGSLVQSADPKKAYEMYVQNHNILSGTTRGPSNMQIPTTIRNDYLKSQGITSGYDKFGTTLEGINTQYNNFTWLKNNGVNEADIYKMTPEQWTGTVKTRKQEIQTNAITTAAQALRNGQPIPNDVRSVLTPESLAQVESAHKQEIQSTAITQATQALRNNQPIPDNIRSVLTPESLAQVEATNKQWQADNAAIAASQQLRTPPAPTPPSATPPTTTPPAIGETSQTDDFKQQAVPTTQQYQDQNPAAFGPGTSAEVKDRISSEALRVLGMLPTPEFYSGQTYAGLTPDQIKAQTMMTGVADTMSAPGGALDKQYQGIGSMLGQLDPTLNPMLKQAQGNVGTFGDAYKGAADFAAGDADISGQWAGRDSRSKLAGFTSRDVNPYLREMYQNQFNPMSRDVLDTGQQLVTDYNRRLMPQLEQAKGLASQATRQFLEGIAPELRTSSNQAGQYGSSKADIAKGLAATRVGEELARQTGQIGLAATLGAGDLNDQIARKYGQFGDRSSEVLGGLVGTEFGNTQNRALQASGQLAGQDYASIVANEEANRQRAQMGMTGMNEAMDAYGGAYGQGMQGVAQGLGMMPSYYQSALMPSQLYGQVGGQNQALNQAGIDQDIQKWNFTQAAPFTNIERAAGIVGVAPYQQQPQRVQSNPWGTAIGGAATMGGMALMNPATAPYAPLFGLMGGVGGYLGGGGGM